MMDVGVASQNGTRHLLVLPIEQTHANVGLLGRTINPRDRLCSLGLKANIGFKIATHLYTLVFKMDGV
jgi:hypothetical protein